MKLFKIKLRLIEKGDKASEHKVLNITGAKVKRWAHGKRLPKQKAK